MLLVLTTLPARSAQRFAEALVRQKLAACVSVLPGVSSTYRWKGKTERARESLLLIKAPENRWKAIQAFVAERHPYELPELIALTAAKGSKKYLDWIRNPGL